MPHHRPHGAPACPCGLEIAALAFPEQLALWAMRKWREDSGGWPVIRREICRACGPAAGGLAHTWLDYLLTLLVRMARRPVRLHQLATRAVSADEAALLALVAATQCNDRAHAEAMARAFVCDAAQAPLLETATLFGAALEIGAQRLPPRYALPRAGDAIH